MRAVHVTHSAASPTSHVPNRSWTGNQPSISRRASAELSHSSRANWAWHERKGRQRTESFYKICDGRHAGGGHRFWRDEFDLAFNRYVTGLCRDHLHYMCSDQQFHFEPILDLP